VEKWQNLGNFFKILFVTKTFVACLACLTQRTADKEGCQKTQGHA